MGQIVIVGAGAAGMMAAITAAKSGARVLLLEQKDRVGKKILSTGNGRCNFTNTCQTPECYRSQNPEFPWKVIQTFPVEQTVSFFDRLGVYAKDRNGYLYPNSDQASSVLDVLRMELTRLKVDIHTQERVLEIKTRRPQVISKKHSGKLSAQDASKRFQIRTNQACYEADAVILTAGSKAAPNTGSDGSGYPLAQKLGHRIIPVVPALVQLCCKEAFYKIVSGVRVHGRVSLWSGRKMLAEDIGELQLTNYGISGIPVFQVSRYAAYTLLEKKPLLAELDFLPELSDQEVTHLLKRRIRNHPEQTTEELFIGLFHKKLAQVLVQESRIARQITGKELNEKQILSLTEKIKHFQTEVIKTNSFEQAQICAGGIDTREIQEATMESKHIAGLYFAGEIVDVDGICGGYNLQWAWSSGYLAGRSAAERKGL